MQPFRYHVFACEQRKAEGAPCCSARGSVAVIEALRRELAAKNLLEVVQVTPSGSLGLCERGPNLVVYPEGIWYSGVTPSDVPEIVSEHFLNGRPVERLMNQDVTAVKKEITDNRGKMMAMLQAREAAGVLPDDLMELIRGYQPSRIVLSALELDVFSVIAKGEPMTAEAAAKALEADARATEVLLNVLVALGLLSKQAGTFFNTPKAKKYLVAGAPHDSRMALRHNSSLWQTWSTLTEVIRAGHLLRQSEMAERDDAWTTPFIAAMHRNAAARTSVVIKAVGVEGVRRMLDVGGGSGAYSIAFAQANPALEATVFDLATVTPIAQRHIVEAGLESRVKTRVGDLRKDQLGDGYDLVLVSAICHMLGKDENRDLLRRVFAATASGGRVVIQDNIMCSDRTSPVSGALFAVNMLVGTQSGGTFTEEEYSNWLLEAGFESARHIPLPGPAHLMVAARP